MLSDKQVKDSGIRFWQLNDCEVYAGFEFNETVEFAMELTGTSREELLDYPHEIRQIDKYMVIEYDTKYQPQYTYRNYLEKILDEGDMNFPQMWTTTEY